MTNLGCGHGTKYMNKAEDVMRHYWSGEGTEGAPTRILKSTVMTTLKTVTMNQE